MFQISTKNKPLPTIIAILLMVAYPEISNFITLVGDEVSSEVGDFNKWSELLEQSAKSFKEFSWSWTSVGDSLIWIVSFIAYGLLYLTVFFFDAAIVFCIILLYTFSPILIVFFILPQTASMTGGLFRTLCEVVCWKIVWSVLGTLLWSTAIQSFEPGVNTNFITQLALTLILTLSVIYTPIIVKAMLMGGLTQVLGQLASESMSGMTGGLLSSQSIKQVSGAPVRVPMSRLKSYRKPEPSEPFKAQTKPYFKRS